MKTIKVCPLVSLILLIISSTLMATPTLRNGWPYYIEGVWDYGIKNQLAIYEHDDFGWIVAVSTNGEICLLDVNGNILDGWPLTYSLENMDSTGSILQGPRMGDLNGDGDPEIAFRTQVYVPYVYNLEVYSMYGERMDQYCVIDTVPTYDDKVFSCPVFVDIDDDGNDELVRIYGNAIHADRYDGTEYPGFPISIGDYCNLYNLGVVVGAGDGWEHDYNIVIWSTVDHVHAQRIGDSGELPGWPIEVVADSPSSFSGPSLIPTDEGWIYVIHCQNVLYAWNQDGEVLEGFPIQNLGSSITSHPITYYLQIADINGDTQPEILYRDYYDKLYALTLEGEHCQGFPRAFYYQSMSDPLAIMYEADSDSAFIHLGSDINHQHIVYTAFHYNSLVQDYEVRVNADPDQVFINRNNTALIPPENDTLLVVSYNSSPTYGLRIYEIPMEGDGTHIEWQMPGNNAGGNRLYCPRYYLGVKPQPKEDVPQSFQINPVYPNPWNNNLQLDLENLVNEQVTVSVFNIMGKMVHRTEYGSGNTVSKWSWNGFDMNGVELSSGIYFVNVVTPSNSYHQKAVLLK